MDRFGGDMMSWTPGMPWTLRLYREMQYHLGLWEVEPAPEGAVEVYFKEPIDLVDPAHLVLRRYWYWPGTGELMPLSTQYTVDRLLCVVDSKQTTGRVPVCPPVVYGPPQWVPVCNDCVVGPESSWARDRWAVLNAKALLARLDAAMAQVRLLGLPVDPKVEDEARRGALILLGLAPVPERAPKSKRVPEPEREPAETSRPSAAVVADIDAVLAQMGH